MIHRHHLALAVALVLAACAGSPDGETSVRPGINQAYYDDPSIDTWRARFERPDREIFAKRDEIVRRIKLRPGLSVADIGAGTGFIALQMAREVGADGTVYAVELMPTFIEHIDKTAREQGVTNLRTVQCTERDLALAPNSIDLAFGCDVYHHFEYPQSSLASLRRALKPGGYFVLVDFHRIPGRSSDWVMGHVRAGQEVFEREIEAAGFEKIGEERFMQTCYFVRFKKTSDPPTDP